MIKVLLIICLFQQGGQSNLDKTGLALSGYDPVSYFTGSPVEGLQTYESTFMGARYLFSSAENKKKFDSSPGKYIPQYGGWCAYALGHAPDKVKVDPETYKIINGKLYLFYNFWGTNTLSSWNKDEKILLPEADKNWGKIVGK